MIQKMFEALPDKSKELTQLGDRLVNLQEKCNTLERLLNTRRDTQRYLKDLSDPQNLIQPNLITKDGPLTEELSKTRALSVRVGGKVAGLKRTLSMDDIEESIIVEDSSSKLRRVFEESLIKD
jgi:hypothetical protein